MNVVFSETLRRLREEKGFSQKQLGKQMFVNHSTIARWENGSRLPDAEMILRLANCLDVDANTLLQIAAQSEESPNIIMVDDSKVLDIELGASSGLDLCHTLLEINPHTNIIFLTAYADYSLDAWQTGASGFILKPMTPESLKEQMNKLRYPLSMAGAEDRVIASL